MSKMVFDKVGGITNQNIVDYVYGGKYTKKDIASFAVICEKAFDLGDESAKKIVSDAAGELFAMLEAVVRELKMCDMAVSCVYTGSILNRFAGVRNIVADLIMRSFPGISFEPCREDAAWGAVLMCLEWMKKKEVM